MSKTLRTVAVVAGAVALVATGVGAAAGAGLLGSTAAGGAAAGIAATAGSVAAYASVIAGVASIGAQLTAKKPPARGSVTDTIIQVDPPQPYMMGRTYSAGVIRHDVGYGGTVNKVKNPYLGKVVVYSGGGPIQEIESRQFDYQPLSFAGGWYFGYVGAHGQLGQTPEPTALPESLGTMPDWGSDYKLSGQAAVLWNFHFDKEGKRFASGIPPYGIVAKGVRVYDPRLDSTYPGGSGSHRLNNEATWQYSENPALHAIAYAYGRRQNGKRVFGVGLPATGIDMARFVTLANICDANAWKVGGTIYEPGNRWDNLKDILAAGGAEPVFAGGVLTLRYRAPMVALDEVTEADLADEDMQVTAMQSYRDRINGVVPKYRSEEHNWQYVSTETVSVPTYVTEDGEEKTQERQYNLVQQADQAAQLAAYELVDGRELGPITVTLKPEWRRYKPGECLHLTLPSLEIDHDAIILSREFDPATMTVRLTLVTETAGKHAFALGQTATPPSSPTLTDPADRDDIAGNNRSSYTWIAFADSIDGTVNFTTGDREDRVFIGIATNQQSATESTNPADYQWAASMGAPGGTRINGVLAEDVVAGAVGTPTLSVTQPAINLYSYENGLVADFSMANGLLKVFAGGIDVMAATTVSSSAVGCTGTINTAANTPFPGQPKGYYRITAAASDNATLTLTAVYGGITRTVEIPVTKIRTGYEIASSLPATNLFTGRKVVLSTDDYKIYTYDGTGWTNALDGGDLTDATVTFGKMVVLPTNLNPDPNFRDTSFWQFAPAWYVEQNDASFPSQRFIVVWSGLYTGTASESVRSRRFPSPAAGDKLRLRAVGRNYGNRLLRVAVVFLNSAMTYMTHFHCTWTAGSGLATKSTQFTVPNGAAWMYIESVIDAGSAFSGDVSIGSITLDVAASASLIVDGDILAQHIGAGQVTAGKLAANSIVALNIQAAQIDANKITLNGVDLANMNASQFTQNGSAYSATSVAYPSYSAAQVYLNCQAGGFFHVELNTLLTGAGAEIQIWDVAASTLVASRILYGDGGSAEIKNGYLRIPNPSSSPKQFQCAVRGAGSGMAVYATTLSFGWGAFS